jgi:hypothetical protein
MVSVGPAYRGTSKQNEFTKKNTFLKGKKRNFGTKNFGKGKNKSKNALKEDAPRAGIAKNGGKISAKTFR